MSEAEQAELKQIYTEMIKKLTSRLKTLDFYKTKRFGY